ncbi:hypothetical protein ColLi_10462 [Colletotrichum liriopes]|uniref:Uncharacterized protein n=1 Tax=Colletotrichum liriopes TaxID=708192 RepID=A0AA37LWR1_9PEZI|nr:hypothetical protein ColLi_10462 [Colletotrichum liriopes]
MRGFAPVRSSYKTTRILAQFSRLVLEVPPFSKTDALVITTAKSQRSSDKNGRHNPNCDSEPASPECQIFSIAKTSSVPVSGHRDGN